MYLPPRCNLVAHATFSGRNEYPCEAKVGQFDIASRADQNITGLYISVYNTAFVTVVHCIEDHICIRLDVRPWQRLSRAHYDLSEVGRMVVCI